MKKYKYFIPALLMMLFIFFESSLTGSSSSSQSNFIVDIIRSFITISDQDLSTLSFIIRKLAHISEYLILTLLLLYGFYKTRLHNYYLTIIISILYACSDEFHQLFVANRAGQFKDVCIDSIGVIIAFVLFTIFIKHKEKKQY